MKARALPCLDTPVAQLSERARARRQERINAAQQQQAVAQMCLTKRAYPTPDAAQRAITQRRAQMPVPTLLRAYRCTHCALWHLTHEAARGRRAPQYGRRSTKET